MDYINAFWVGGLICALTQILLDRTKLMPGRVMVLLVCGGALLGFCGLYDPFQKLAGAGAGVPLPGFGNVLWQGVKEAVDKYGFMGVFMGGFQASAVGISARFTDKHPLLLPVLKPFSAPSAIFPVFIPIIKLISRNSGKCPVLRICRSENLCIFHLEV